MKLAHKLLLLVMLIALFVSGCDLLPQPEPFITGTPWPTFTPLPSSTPLPTATFTPTPYVAGLAGTPAAQSSSIINQNNLKKLTQLNRISQGVPHAITWSNNGDLLAVAASRGVSIYNGGSLFLLGTIDSTNSPRSLDFTPNGNAILCGNNDGSLTLWDLNSGELKTINRAHIDPVFSVDVSPDGKWAASASWDKTIRIWRFTDGTSQPLILTSVLTGHNEDVRKVKFSPDGKRLYSWSPRRQVQIWQAPYKMNDDELYIGTAGGGLSATSLAFSPDGGLVAALQNNKIKIYRTDDGTTLSTLTPFNASVFSAALSDDGSLAVTLEPNTLKFWNAEDGKLLHDLPLPDTVDANALLALSSDNRRVILLSGSFWVWDLPADLTEDKPASKAEIINAGFLPDDRFFTLFASNGTNLTSALHNGRLYETPLNQPFAAQASSSYADTPTLMTASSDLAWIAAGTGQRLLIWPADGETSPDALITSDKHRRELSAIAFSHDNTLAASSDGQGKLNLWDTTTGSHLQTLNGPIGVSALTFSPDDKLLAVTSGAGIQLWQTDDWSLLDSFSGTAAAFSLNGDLLAAAAWDEGEEVIFLRTIGRESTSITQRIPLSGNALAFSPDGTLLTVSGKTLTILRASDGKILFELAPPLSFGTPFFSPDGTYLALAHWDGTVSLWGIP